MIHLFNINNYHIDTSQFSNLLHDKIVTEFEERFAEYVGAPYACSANSASSLIYLSLKELNAEIEIPTMMAPVVPNVIVNTENELAFRDDISWIGHMYRLYDGIYDSAQQVSRDQYDQVPPGSVIIYSFYPTKPVGGCDGGMIVSDNKDTIDWYKTMTLNGMEQCVSSWNNRKQTKIGYKFHCNSIQAYVANENLKKLDAKKQSLDFIRDKYDKELGVVNHSHHLYRINVRNNKKFLDEMRKRGIMCGIHYECCHKPFGIFYKRKGWEFPKSEKEANTTVSLPYHEQLTVTQVNRVIKYVKKLKDIQ